jgi:AraC family transcriptional regulator, regulatory protein of adaptative response / methylated-DNA-[protein]-cysteine methyltransferase
MMQLPSRDEMMRAFLASDEVYDGLFFVGVKTTSIFCRPICPARKPKPENCDFFATAEDALHAGFRPCLRCAPTQAKGSIPDWLSPVFKSLDETPDLRLTGASLRELGVDPARARRWFLRHHGQSLAVYARNRRLGHALKELRKGASIDDAALNHGYESHSGFRDAFSRQFGDTPGRSRSQEPILTTIYPSPVGPLLLGATDEGICLLEFQDPERLAHQLGGLEKAFKLRAIPGEHRWLDAVRGELDRYFSGELKSFATPLVLRGTAFQERCWRELMKIPYAETLSYVELARRIDNPGASRAVGTANGANRIAIIIPCHRVVNVNGKLGGYGGGLWRKQRLLELEQGSRGLWKG